MYVIYSPKFKKYFSQSESKSLWYNEGDFNKNFEKADQYKTETNAIAKASALLDLDTEIEIVELEVAYTEKTRSKIMQSMMDEFNKLNKIDVDDMSASTFKQFKAIRYRLRCLGILPKPGEEVL